MKNVIDWKKYGRVNAEDIEFVIEKNRVGDFWGKTDKEVLAIYQEIADKLNNMLENPCGQTSYELARSFS